MASASLALLVFLVLGISLSAQNLITKRSAPQRMNPEFYGKWKLDLSSTVGLEAFCHEMKINDPKFIEAYKNLPMTFTLSPHGEEGAFQIDLKAGPYPKTTRVMNPGTPRMDFDHLVRQPIEVTAVIDTDGNPTAFYVYKTMYITRTEKKYVSNNVMTAISTVNGVSMTRYFNRVEGTH